MPLSSDIRESVFVISMPFAAIAALICSVESSNRGRVFCLSGSGGNEVIIGLAGVVSTACSVDPPQPAARAQTAAMVIVVVTKRIRHSPFLRCQI
ncbi:hypothetical protein [Mycolicibacterium sp. HK-90]|uniref:hypothetical protein n=1 Tax=Mycolicibacterium sp. HK-90 TaxID=3056937 RepID=UPI003461821A